MLDRERILAAGNTRHGKEEAEMLKRYLSLWMVPTALLLGLLVILPPAPAGAEPPGGPAQPLNSALGVTITCLGFGVSGHSKIPAAFEQAIVYVYNFGSTAASVTVRSAHFNDHERKVQSEIVDSRATGVFLFTSVLDLASSAHSFRGNAEVISSSKDVLVDAEKTSTRTLTMTSGAAATSAVAGRHHTFRMQRAETVDPVGRAAGSRPPLIPRTPSSAFGPRGRPCDS